MNDQRIIYGACCVWWDSIDKVASGEGGLPVCPFCKRPLMEVENEEVWFKGVRAYEADNHPGYYDYIVWLRGKCYPTNEIAWKAYQVELLKRN
jgi:hypothetical protein